MSASRIGGGAKHRLMSEMQELSKEKWVNIDLVNDNILRWRLGLIVLNPDSAFNGGYFRAEMTFTDEYPYQPPTFRFLIPIYHPNVYPDGKLCISILHTPGEDLTSGEQASERWSPLQGVESVLRSVLLLLDDPEINSPANVDAGVMYRDDRTKYNKKAQDIVERSKNDIPDGFVMPTNLEPPPPPKSADDDPAFWAESDDEELDFGGSDTGEDADLAEFDEDGEEEGISDDDDN